MKAEGSRSLLIALAVLAGAARLAGAAELRLRPQCTAGGPVVRLGDVAEIVGGDSKQAETLAAVELFPAPADREQRFLRVRELQDLLLLHGVNLAEHQFSGSSQVMVLGKSAATKPQSDKPVPAPALRRISRRACEAITKYLTQHVPGQRAWGVEVELTDAQAHMLADPTRAVSVAGGNPPWTGLQHFEVTLDAPKGPASFTLDAQVSVRASMVVAARALPRGAIVRDGDVELANEVPVEGGSTPLRSLDDALGRETTRAVAAGKLVDKESLRTPLLVRRGEVVTVYANSSGIRIRTVARARDDAGLGELVSVESLLDRAAYYARVSGVREVEVYARSARAERPEAEAADNVVRR